MRGVGRGRFVGRDAEDGHDCGVVRESACLF